MTSISFDDFVSDNSEASVVDIDGKTIITNIINTVSSTITDKVDMAKVWKFAQNDVVSDKMDASNFFPKQALIECFIILTFCVISIICVYSCTKALLNQSIPNEKKIDKKEK
jgi:hypothetical protein